MCEANVYMAKGGVEQEIMRDVILIKAEGDRLLMADLLGNRKDLGARVKLIDMEQHKVVLEEM